MSKPENDSLRHEPVFDIEPLMTVEEIAALLKCSKAAIYAWALEGAIPSIKIGGARRFVRKDILDWINDCRDSSNGYNNPADRRPPKERRNGRGPL